MSDVREQLVKLLYTGDVDVAGFYELADAILERFDVTPKPVVNTHNLGVMVATAYNSDLIHAAKGQQMLVELRAAGLTIVRIEEVAS